MKKKYESPTIDWIYFYQSVKLLDASNDNINDEFFDENVDNNGWV